MRISFLLALAGLAVSSGQKTESSREGSELLGKPAPSLEGLRWIGREPPPLEILRGKVVLVRRWTDGCVLCERSAPAIREFEERYREKGLAVLAIYHPKPRPRPVEDEFVKKAAAALGLPGSIAVDAGWTVLRRWWLDRKREFTSVSFLLDREGKVRWVHPGGEFHRSQESAHVACARAFAELEAEVKALLR